MNQDRRISRREYNRIALGYLPTQKRPQKLIASLDLETDGLFGRFLLAGYAYQDKPTECHYLESVEDIVSLLLSHHARRYVWIAHNGARYDYKYLLEPLNRRIESGEHLRYRLMPQGRSGCIGLVIWCGTPGHENRIELRDSYALMAESLASLTKALADQFHKLEFDHDHVRFNPDSPIHREYLKNDVLGLLEVYTRYRAIILEHFGVPVGWTSASTGLKAWRHTIPKTHVYFRQSKPREAFARQAYYGGLVFFRDGKEHRDVISIDVNAMYPYVQRKYGVPCGLATWTTEEKEGKYGIYEVTATVPVATPYPLVPYHHCGVAWPTGQFTTVLHSPEMAFARECGCAFTVHRGYYYDRMENPFDLFVTRCEHLRTTYPKGSAVERAVKLLGNGGAYGKFGSNPTVRELMVSRTQPPDEAAGIWYPSVDETTGELVSGQWQREVMLDAPYIKPEWAGAITTFARLELRRLAALVGFDRILYSDTDNLKMLRRDFEKAVSRNAFTIGSRFGDVKIDGMYTHFRATGPKCYLFRTVESGTRWIVGANKGMPRKLARPEAMIAAWNGEKIQETLHRGNGILQMVKHGAPIGEQKQRAYTMSSHLQNWRKQADETVRPIHLELAE